MAFSQDDLIFPTYAVATPGPLPSGAERVDLPEPGGATLHGLHIPPARRPPGPKTLVLGFGGNAWNGEDVAAFLHDLYPEAHVVTFHYRGYRPSTGKPSAEALIADAPLIFDFTVERVEPERVVVVGFSIGSGIAASLAKRRDIDGLILVTPFDSMKAVAGDLYPWLPVGLLFRHEIDSAGFLRGAGLPVAIIAAERDEIIPPRRTQALREQVPNLAYDRTIAGAGHNDIYTHPDFGPAMRDALRTVGSS